MAHVIQVIDSVSSGTVVRLSDGRTVTVRHGATIGEDVAIAPSLDFLESEAQVAANILSHAMDPAPDTVFAVERITVEDSTEKQDEGRVEPGPVSRTRKKGQSAA